MNPWLPHIGPRRRTIPGWTFFVLRAAAGVVVGRRLAAAASTAAPITIAGLDDDGRHAGVTVVVPARDEARRIGPLLERVVGAPGVVEVIVVDDESTDGTAGVAAALGARVIEGTSPPPLAGGGRWAGKAWALQQGIEAAHTDWVVTLDADTRPEPGLPAAAAVRAAADGYDLVTLAGRFECPSTGTAWLHPALLTTLVYRFGPPGTTAAPGRELANGQCTVLRRDSFLASGGMAPVAGSVVEDVALARHRAALGQRVGFLDAGSSLDVRMFETIADTWRGWSRSIALPGVERRSRQVLDLAVVLVTQALPLPRLASRRSDVVDLVLAIARIGTLAGTRRAYPDGGAVYWASPTADPVAVAALAIGVARGTRQQWRGRRYD